MLEQPVLLQPVVPVSGRRGGNKYQKQRRAQRLPSASVWWHNTPRARARRMSLGERGEGMRRKKRLQDMSQDELIQFGQALAEQHQRRNARRRERRRWLKNAPREQTALRYRGEEKPCSIAVFLQAEGLLLRRLPDIPDLQGNAVVVLLTLAHMVLHLLHAPDRCAADTIMECPEFSVHEICSAAVEIGLNYHPDPTFKLKHTQIVFAIGELMQGIDKERLHFNTLLGDLPIDL